MMDWKCHNYKEVRDQHKSEEYLTTENVWYYFDDDGVVRVRINYDEGCWSVYVRSKSSDWDWSWYEIEECFVNVTDAKRFVQNMVEEMEKKEDD